MNVAVEEEAALTGWAYGFVAGFGRPGGWRCLGVVPTEMAGERWRRGLVVVVAVVISGGEMGEIEERDLGESGRGYSEV